ncbi:MAG: hypothetical protein PW792_16450 [Acidobacteriaceae bacterium]|nr:hypothetical protein [Acidobacteriaceae bacterium]
MTPNYKLVFAVLALSSSVAFAQMSPVQDAAPIERPAPSASASTSYAADQPMPQVQQDRPHHLRGQIATHVLNPAQGVRVLTNTQLETIATGNGRTELRLSSGKANVIVDNPADGALILIDLPGGQVDLIRDGFYTLNAQTNRVSVLHGEAKVFAPDAPANAEGKTVKEGQGVVLNGHPHPDDLYDSQAQADILPWSGGAGPSDVAMKNGQQQQGYPQGYTDSGCDGCASDYGYYGDGFYAGYPYYGYGYGYGYPGWGWGFGYPGYGWGLGLGYYGGYYGGGYGYRGGYGGYRGGYGGYRGGGGFGGFHGGGGGGFHGGGGGGFHGGGGGGFHGGGGGHR